MMALKKKNFLPGSQISFRKGYSCPDSLAIFKLDIEQALKNDKHVLAVCLDVSNAFNNVQNPTLLQKLADKGCSNKI